MNWWQFLISVVVLFIYGRISIWLYLWNNQRRQTKFLKMLHVEHPDSKFYLTTVSGRDDVAFRKLRQMLETRV